MLYTSLKYVFESCLLRYVHEYVPTYVRITHIDSLYVLILQQDTYVHTYNTANTYIVVSFCNNQFALYCTDMTFSRYSDNRYGYNF